MLVVSSPSGAGKTTLTRNLIETEKHITLSVSVTTRTRRPSEIDGVHYHFIPRRRFDIMRDSGELLEWAEVHGNCYGTPREPVEQALAAGRDVLFDIDWQGTRQLYEAMRDDVVSVFVLPPSAAELKARLERRAEDSHDIIVKRLKNAAEEIAHWPEYDYVLVNRDLDKSFLRLRSILTAERLKRVHRDDMERFVGGLLDGLKDITT
ncbi:guanylate kinase [Rhodoplanes sp. SY1]|uniref:guanylate kinase n=1 Tax=Rhodoplanes sp. SY1 TaxID=3166646 RepID=UPI0038B4F485